MTKAFVGALALRTRDGGLTTGELYPLTQAFLIVILSKE